MSEEKKQAINNNSKDTRSTKQGKFSGSANPSNKFSKNRSKNPRFSKDKRRGSRFDRNKKKRGEEMDKYKTQVIQVRRVTKVVKGGKLMKFSAMVVVGDGEGMIGYALRKGTDFQDAVSKATRIAQKNMFKVQITDQGSLSFPTTQKFKSSKIFLKPALSGTGLIAGGFIRPVLELAGIKNVYSKIIGSRNKVVGVRCVIQALKKYQAK